MQSPSRTLTPDTPGYRASFAEEAKVIVDQLQRHGGTDISTIEAELPPVDLTPSASFLDLTSSDQVQTQHSDSPLPPSPLPSDRDLLFLSPSVASPANLADMVRWQLNVTMELHSLSPDAFQAAEPTALAKSPTSPQPSTELNKTCLLSSGTPAAETEGAQAGCSHPPDARASGEESLLAVQELTDMPINQTFLFSQTPFVTSTPHGGRASGLSEGEAGFFPESPPAQEAPSMTVTDQPSARHPQGPPAAPGRLPKATPKSGPLGKVVQQKRSLGGATLAVSKRGYQALPLPGQKRWSAGPYKASGLPILIKSRREPLAPPGPRQQKGRNSEAGKMKETELPAKAGNSAPSATKASQLLRSKSVPPRFSLHQRGSSAQDPKSKEPQGAPILKPLASNQGVRPRAPSKTVVDEQAPKQDGKQQPSPAQMCSQCLVLQKQVEDLKSQLAAMQCLSGELQGLQGAVQDGSTANRGGTT